MSTSESAAIHRDIDETRDRLGSNLDELANRLNPDRLKQQAKDTVRRATIGRIQTVARRSGAKVATVGRDVSRRARPLLPLGLAVLALAVAGACVIAVKRSEESRSRRRFGARGARRRFR